MTIFLGDIAPDFTQQSTEGEIQFHRWLGTSWGILFSHPADFTPVCTTELGLLAKIKHEFTKRNVKVLALSVDPLEFHVRWIEDINETQQTQVNFPILADSDRKVSELYNLISKHTTNTLTVRSVLIIDPFKKVRLILTYPINTGRNFDEIIRVVDSLQLTDSYHVSTPANWHYGDEVVINTNLQSPSDLAGRFPQGYRELKPYLRLTQLSPSIYESKRNPLIFL